MTIRIPPEADQNTRNAFTDIENRLKRLEQKSAQNVVPPVTQVVESPLYEDTEILKSANFDGDVRVDNDLEVKGSVDIPGAFEGMIQTVPIGTGGTSHATNQMNIQGSVAIAPGGLSADSLRGRVLDVPPSERNMPDISYTRLVDDFIFSGPVTATDDGKIGELGWNYFDNVAGAPVLYNEAGGHIGAIYIGNSSMTNNTHYCSLYARNTQYLYPIGGVNRVRETWVVRFGSSLTDTKQRWGLQDNVTYSGQDDQINFVLDNGNFDTNIRCISEADGTSTTTDSGVAAATTEWFTCVFDWDCVKREIKFYIDGALVATHTGSSVPHESGTNSQMMPAMSIKYIETSWGAFTLDYYSHEVWTARGKN
jgi:hypothetical protein